MIQSLSLYPSPTMLNPAAIYRGAADPVVSADLETDYRGQDLQPLIRQVSNEKKSATDFMTPKIEMWKMRLKLYNNQMRDADAVGDPLIFTTMQTVIASLYEDELQVSFQGREEGDSEIANNLHDLAIFDRDLMDKDQLDYDWIWNTCFFGRGLVLMREFDLENKCPVPEVIDNLTFLRDPIATSANGTMLRQKGALRYWGQEVSVTLDSMENDSTFFNLEYIHIKNGNGINSLAELARVARSEAAGTNYTTLNYTETDGDYRDDNCEYKLTEWYTHWRIGEKVKKVCVHTANGTDLVVRFEVLKDQKDWPLVDRPLYPTAHDWDGTSIPDLIEDKQRASAIVTNLSIKSMKSDQHPTYVFNKDKIKNRNSLTFGFDRFIPVEGDVNGAVAPINKANPNMNLASWIISTLDASGQKATATPDIQQGQVSGEQRTLGELNLVASKVDTRYTLSLKIFGWSEKRFWRMWYRRYKEFYRDGIGEKIARISGAFGDTWRPLAREDVIGALDPDVNITSRIVSDATSFRDFEQFKEFASFLQADPAPTHNKRYLIKKYASYAGLQADELVHLLPPDIQEMLAEGENKLLNDNQKVKIAEGDNHILHLMIHAKAKTNKYTVGHIEAHKAGLLMERQQQLSGTEEAPGGESADPGASSLMGGAPTGQVPGLEEMTDPNMAPSDQAGQTNPTAQPVV